MQDIQIEDLLKRLRQTRADMLGTDDEEHYFDVHDAATALQFLQERVKELEADAARWRRLQAERYGGTLLLNDGLRLNGDEPESEWDAALSQEGCMTDKELLGRA